MKPYTPIVFHAGNCLNVKKPYLKECRRCIDSCPHKAIDEKKHIDINKCTECGLCTASCPSDGLVDRDLKNIEEYIFASPKIVFHCPCSSQPLGYEIGCLGMFDRDAWTTLLALAESKDVIMLTGDCSSCDDRQACAVSEAILQEILNEWPDHPEIKKEFHSAHETFDGMSYEKVAGPRKKKLWVLFPALEAEETYLVPSTRHWLAKALGLDTKKKVPFLTLKANENCTGCEACVKICPQGALQLASKDGKNLLLYEPFKCVRCGRCVETCKSDALMFAYVKFTYQFLTGKIILREIAPTYCKRCGQRIFIYDESGLCPACVSKNETIQAKRE